MFRMDAISWCHAMYSKQQGRFPLCIRLNGIGSKGRILKGETPNEEATASTLRQEKEREKVWKPP